MSTSKQLWRKKDLKVGDRLQRKVLNSENTHTLKKQMQNAVWKINNGLQKKMNLAKKDRRSLFQAIC